MKKICSQNTCKLYENSCNNGIGRIVRCIRIYRGGIKWIKVPWNRKKSTILLHRLLVLRAGDTDKKLSTKMRKYETELCKLNNCSPDKHFVSIAQQYLTTIIIEKNKKTADIEEGKRLYRELMDEE